MVLDLQTLELDTPLAFGKWLTSLNPLQYVQGCPVTKFLTLNGYKRVVVGTEYVEVALYYASTPLWLQLFIEWVYGVYPIQVSTLIKILDRVNLVLCNYER